MSGFGEQKERNKQLPQQKSQMSDESLLNIAIKHHTQSNLKNAEKAYRAAIDIGISNAVVFSNLGAICQATLRLDEAIAYYEKAIAINPNHSNSFTNLGSLYKDLGKLDQALACAFKSLELDPDNHAAQMSLGSIYKDFGSFDRALASTLKSLDLNPGNPAIHRALGVIYQDLGKLDQALEFTLKSLRLNTDDPAIHMRLSVIYQDLGNLDEALKSLQEASRSEKTREKALTRYADLCCQNKLYKEGVAAISELASKSSQNLLLSLHLCLDDRLNFNKCAAKLVTKNLLDQRGAAAIDHANIIYSQNIGDRLSNSTLDSIFIQRIDNQEFPDSFIK